MKLNDIKPLNESSTPIHMTMILQEIVKAGKCTNTIHYVILAQLVELFKFAPNKGRAQIVELSHYTSAISPRYAYENPTPKVMLDELRALDGEHQKTLAVWCLNQLSVVETIEDTAQWCNPAMKLVDWIAHVTRAQK